MGCNLMSGSPQGGKLTPINECAANEHFRLYTSGFAKSMEIRSERDNLRPKPSASVSPKKNFLSDRRRRRPSSSAKEKLRQGRPATKTVAARRDLQALRLTIQANDIQTVTENTEPIKHGPSQVRLKASLSATPSRSARNTHECRIRLSPELNFSTTRVMTVTNKPRHCQRKRKLRESQVLHQAKS